MPLAKPHSSGDPSTTSQHDLANSPPDVTTRYLQAASLPNDDRTPPQPDSQPESLKDQATHILDEARTVLPGIQALFGFQLIAVFSDRFATGLTEAEQRLHFASIVLVVLAIGLVMTPAAYHRQIDSNRITKDFVDLSSWLIAGALVPLMVALSLDVYVVAQALPAVSPYGAEAAVGSFGLLFVLWLILPRVRGGR